MKLIQENDFYCVNGAHGTVVIKIDDDNSVLMSWGPGEFPLFSIRGEENRIVYDGLERVTEENLDGTVTVQPLEESGDNEYNLGHEPGDVPTTGSGYEDDADAYASAYGPDGY